MPYQIIALGESALCITFAHHPDMLIQSKLWGLAGDLRTEFGETIEIIFGMNNLTIVYPPFEISDQILTQKIAHLWHKQKVSQYKGRLIEVPVFYGNDNGPDLEEVADHCQMSPSEVIKRHSQNIYTVYFLGFQPGFAYMGELDSGLHTPRKKSPRLEVAAGSVGIGGIQTGIYPSKTPGGWQLIGRTELVLFDPSLSVPSLFQPGDQIQFIPI